MTQHVMLDLETWGKGPQAAIISIGAVKFDPAIRGPFSEFILDKFHVAIHPESCQQFGLKFDASTLLWWMDAKQDAARQDWLGMAKVDLPSALEGFDIWYMGAGRAPDESRPVWGNGVGFDNIILRNAYSTCGLLAPWSYRDDRDFRTMKNLADSLGRPVPSPEQIGTTHNALDDALFQTQWLFDIESELNIELA